MSRALHCFWPALSANDGERIDAVTLRMVMASVERRGRAMASFCAAVRSRGDVGVTEETIDLPRLRCAWLAIRDRLRSGGGR